MLVKRNHQELLELNNLDQKINSVSRFILIPED